ncbi:hypothetical protein TWF281_002749 [Arthrobotrys megalospora]
MATESGIAISRSPTPTLRSGEPFDERSDIPSTTNTDISSNSDDDDDGDDGDDGEHVNHFVTNTSFSRLIDTLNTITESSTQASVGTSTTSLRKYYLQKLTEVSNNPEYDVPLTNPPCPYITVKAVDHMRYSDNCSISCPCCLPDDLPHLRIVSGEVEGGVITYNVLLRELATWLYGPDQQEPLGLGQEAALGQTVDGIPAGEAGVMKWNFMSDARRGEGETLELSLMGLELYLYFAKPLVGGGMHDSYRDDDTDGCGRGPE